MADGGRRSRFNPVYFNGRRIVDFSTLRPKNKSKVRKQRTGCSARPLASNRAQYIPENGAANTVTDDEAEVDVGDGLHEQPSSTACEAVSEDQGTLMVEQSIIQEYVLLLCRYDGVTMIDHRRFCLPQFNSSQHKLMEKSYVFIERFAYYLQKGDTCWLYACSCDVRRSALVSSLACRLDLGSTNCFDFLGEDCSHISALLVLVDELDNVFDITPDDCLLPSADDHNYSSQLKVVKLRGASSAVGVMEPNPAVVFCDHGFSCLGCNRGRVCDHTKYLQYLKDNIHESPEDVADLLLASTEPDTAQSFPSSSNNSVIPPTSQLPIPFDLTESLQHVLIDLPENRLPVCPDTGALLLVPPLPPVGSLHDKCSQCQSAWNIDDPLVNGWKGGSIRLYTRKQWYECNVYYRPCSDVSCGSRLLYDGRESAILCMKKFAVTYDVLRDYMFHFLEGRCTMYTYYNIWGLVLQDAGVDQFQMLFSYNMWRSTWYGFLNLLDIDYSSGFCCPICGCNNVDTIICDGTTLAFRKELCSLLQPSSSSDSHPQDLFTGRYQDRVFIVEKSIRDTLLVLCSNPANITDEMYTDLLSKLSPTYPELAGFLNCCFHQYGKDAPFPSGISKFILAVSKKTPICAIFRPIDELQGICTKILQGHCVKQHPADMLLLQRKCPLLFELITEIDDPALISKMRDLLRKLLQIAGAPFRVNGSPEVPIGSEGNAIVDGLTYFPSLPILRGRGCYQVDRQRSTSEVICNKKAGRHPSLLPGIFLVHCEHGITYGFSVMISSESPNVPFTIIRTRFPEAPKTIVYDNGCNLHAYALNRDPVHFKNSTFLVDRLHWRDHTGCSSAYNISLYPEMDTLNTQVAEQRNSVLQRVKSALSYMNQDNFMRHCKFYLWYRNKKIIASLSR